MSTLTQSLAKRMAAVRGEMKSTIEMMGEQTKQINQRHDEIAYGIKTLDARIAKNPGDETLSKMRDEYDRVRSGLYAASEYGTGLIEQVRAAR